MKLRRWVALSSFSTLIVLAACGGSSSSDLLKPDTSQLGNQPSDPSSTSSASANPPATGTAPDASPNTEVPDASGSNDTDAGTTSDAGTDSGDDDDDDDQDATVRCGTSSCHAGTQVCCASIGNQGKPKFQCQPAGIASCSYGVKLACDDRSDCPTGTVCCAARDNGSFVAATCQATCESTENALVARLCDPKAAVDECASIGKKCGSTDFGYSACRD